MPAKNVTATASFTTNPNSYTITANQVAEGGTLKIALKNGTKAVGAEIADTTAAKTLTAYSGETLTISAVHGSGYKLKKLTVTDGNGPTEYTNQSTVTINPVASDVTATAEFEEGETLPNDYTAEKGSTITAGEANGSIFANIKATFYDYYTDGEVAGGWYKGINAQTEGWIGGISERNPYKTLNSALSEYADENRVQYPLYFGSFYVTSYQDPNYYHSAANYPFYGDRINDSNALGGTTGHNSWALPGLAGSSLSGGNIYYTNGTNGGNGAPMELFDKEWLTSRSTSDPDADKLKLVYSDSYNWADSNAKVYVGFRDSWPHEYWVEMTHDSANKRYTAEIPSGWEDKNVVFVRINPSNSLTTGEINDNTTANGNWNKIENKNGYSNVGWGNTGVNLSRDGLTYTLTSFSAGTWSSGSYTGALASFMNTSFPVYKRTQEGATYYEFDSSSAHYDTVYFSDLDFDDPSGSTPQIQFSTGDVNKSIMNGFNGGVGFFPFDRYDVNKVSGKSDRYGKDLATGMKLEFKFTLGKNASGQEGYILKDGATGNSNSDYVAQKFNFSGDDDLWVYVDDNLILDLGGDHSKTVGTINFATKTVTGVTADTVLTAAQGITRNSSFTLADKKVHTMTIYYMERGMHESNLKFGFSMSPLATDFSTEKEVDASKLNAGIGMYDASTNTNGFKDSFEFINTSYNSDGTTVNDHSKSKAYKYYKWDTAQNKYVEQSGSYSSDSSGKFTLNSDPTKQYADFDNKLKVNDVLQVTETSQLGYHYNTTYEILDEEYLVDGEPDLIKAGSGTDTGKFIFKTIMPNADVNTDVTNIRVKFLNELKTQTVYVKKEIKNDYLTTDSFEIQVGLKMINGSTVTNLNTAGLKYKSDDDNYVTEKSLDSDGRCSIRQDETLRFEGIPEGATVTITETAKTGYTIDSITHSESNNTLSYTSGAYTASVVLDKIDTITITNEKLFDLKIEKELTGESAPAGTYFPIMVSVKQPGGTLTPITVSNYANYTYDVATMPTSAGTGNANDVYFDTSTGYFMLKPGEDFTIKSFKKDTEFTVAEKTDAVANCIYDSMVVDGSQTAAADYTDSANNLSGKQGIKIGAKDITVTVNNAMIMKKSFTIKKEMASGSAAETGDFTIRVETSTDANTWTALANGAFTRGTNGTGTLNGNGETTIKADEILTFTNLVNVNTYIRVAEAKAMPLDNSYDSIAATVGGSSADVTTYSDTDWQGGYFKLTDAANVIITNNKVHRRTITITKTTTAAHDVAAKFRIRIQTSPDGTDWTDYHTDISATLGSTPSKVSANVVTEGSVYEYLIQKDQVFTLSLPEGMHVRVTENDGVTTTGTDYDVNNYYNYNSTVVKEQDDGASAPDRGTAYSSGNYKGSTYKIGTKNAQFIIKNDPIMETVTVIKNTDFYEDGSTFELEAKIKPQYAGNDDDIVDNDGLVKVLATDPDWTAPSPAPSDGKYTIKKTGSIKFSVPKGTRLKVTETSNFGPSQITGKQRFTFDKMVLDTDTASTPAIEQSNGRNFLVDGARTLTVYNKVMKNNVTIQKKFVDSDGSSDSVHKIKVFARKNGISGDYYGTEYAANTSNDDRIKYTTSRDSTERYLTGGDAGDEITIHGNETITLHRLYVGSYITVQETEIGAGYRFNRIDVSGYADAADSAQFPGGVPSGVSIPAKTYDATKKTVSFQTRDVAAAVEVINEKLPLYQIKYKYEGYSATTYLNTTDKDNDHRVVGAERFFVQSGYITETELKDWFNVTETSIGSIGTIAFKDIESRTSFLSAHAPYEDDFMMDLKWDGNTVSTPVYTPATKTLSLETTATSAPNRTVNVYFKLPYDVNNETLEPSSETPVMITAVQHPMTTQYGNWVTTNGEYKNEEAADFVTAPLTLENGQHFQYWQITSAKTTKRDTAVDSKRCYYDQFNMTMYQDCYVEPVYEASPADFDPSARSLADTQNGEARISFIENSRNQWNEQGGGTGMIGDRLQAGDRIYSDFLLTFGYQDRLLNTTNHGGVSQAGFVLEQVRELDTADAQGKYYTKKASEYAAEYSDTSMDTLKTNVRSYIGGTDVPGFVAKPKIDLSGLDNKNQTKYSLNMKNKAYATLAEGTAKNYVYRAYSYLKVGNDIVVSDPVYFTIYDMASIELGQTDAQGGQS